MTQLLSLSDQELVAEFREAYRDGADFLEIRSRRQDVGIAKCERGIKLGYLRKTVVLIDSQETHWRYYWTDKSNREFRRSA